MQILFFCEKTWKIMLSHYFSTNFDERTSGTENMQQNAILRVLWIQSVPLVIPSSKLSQFVVLCWDNKFLHFFSICDHQAQFWSCTYPACRKIRQKKLLTKTKISKFLCAWCSTILKIFETTLYTHKVFVATILACYNFLAQLQGCSKWAYCIFYTFFFKKFFCCTQQAQQKNFFIIFWKSVWRSQNFFLRP